VANIIARNDQAVKVAIKLAAIPQEGGCLGILAWLRADLAGSYEQQEFDCQIGAFSHGFSRPNVALRLTQTRQPPRSSWKTLVTKLQWRRLTLITTVDLPGTEPQAYEASCGIVVSQLWQTRVILKKSLHSVAR
jgi:hypothetical protein